MTTVSDRLMSYQKLFGCPSGIGRDAEVSSCGPSAMACGLYQQQLFVRRVPHAPMRTNRPRMYAYGIPQQTIAVRWSVAATVRLHLFVRLLHRVRCVQ